MTPPITTPSNSGVSIIQEYYKVLSQGPSEEHFQEFIDSLPEGHQSYYLQQGFKASQQNVLFRRFYQERVGERLTLLQRSPLTDVMEPVAHKTNTPSKYSPNALLIRYDAVIMERLVKVFISFGQIHAWMSRRLT